MSIRESIVSNIETYEKNMSYYSGQLSTLSKRDKIQRAKIEAEKECTRMHIMSLEHLLEELDNEQS